MTNPIAPPGLKLNPVRGRRPVLQNFAVTELQIDPSYQRSIETSPSQSLIRRIARDWDWRLCQPLLVAGRGDAGLFVVDGQHRLAAARLRGDIGDLPCVMFSYRDVNEEAAAFVELNRARKPLKALDVFRGMLASGDPEASIVARLIGEAGLALAPHDNYSSWKPGVLSNVGGLQRALREHGEGITLRALRVLAGAFPDQVLRFGATLFAGICPLLAELGDAADDGLLIMVLSAQSQAEWVAEIADHGLEHGLNRSSATVSAIRAAYRDALAADEEEAA